MSHTFNEADIIRDAQGKFAGRKAGAPQASLGQFYEKIRLQRENDLTQSGKTPAISINRPTVNSRKHFWADALRTAPIDLDNPAPKIERVINGVQTYQHSYSGAAGNLRMPSIAALNRMADSGVETFDIPVSASNGKNMIAGWARVHRDKNGVWQAQAMGMDSPFDSYVTRQVSWVLGNEKPSFALNEYADMAGVIAAQDAQHGSEPAPLKSSVVSEVAYDSANQTVYVATKDGSAYGYQAPADVYDRLLIDDHPGRIFSKELARTAPSVPAQQCPTCGRFNSYFDKHVCPKRVPDPTTTGNDGYWAAFADIRRDRRVKADPAQLVENFMVKTPRIGAIGLKPKDVQTSRWRGVSGNDAQKLADCLENDRFSSTLLKAARSPQLSVNGRVDSQGVRAEELVYQTENTECAWENLKNSYPVLSGMPEPDRTVVQGQQVRFWWANSSQVA
ncbi:KTSC domain-containing protein [Actinomyces vulturis]|uniref:KTSC domain-containing protein n=1 Tax=Actinomyces vulturis TaxID=1857645 RepID=UPI0008316092|nr:KTSC domain-containing protein [Actinomyces vulturis]